MCDAGAEGGGQWQSSRTTPSCWRPSCAQTKKIVVNESERLNAELQPQKDLLLQENTEKTVMISTMAEQLGRCFLCTHTANYYLYLMY